MRIIGAEASDGSSSNSSSSASSQHSSQGSDKDSSRNDSRKGSRDGEIDKLSLKLVRVCAWIMERKAATATPKSLVCCLYEFGLLQLLPWRLLLLLRRRLQQRHLLRQLDGQGLALLALSFALLQQRDTKLIKKIGLVLQQEGQQHRADVHLGHRRGRQELPNQSLCLLLHAVAKLDIREKPILYAFCDRIER